MIIQFKLIKGCLLVGSDVPRQKPHSAILPQDWADLVGISHLILLFKHCKTSFISNETIILSLIVWLLFTALSLLFSATVHLFDTWSLLFLYLKDSHHLQEGPGLTLSWATEVWWAPFSPLPLFFASPSTLSPLSTPAGEISISNLCKSTKVRSKENIYSHFANFCTNLSAWS